MGNDRGSGRVVPTRARNLRQALAGFDGRAEPGGVLSPSVTVIVTSVSA